MKRQPWKRGNNSSDVNIKINLRDGVDTLEQVEDGVRWPAGRPQRKTAVT
jgi:hypothetical protein